MHLCIVRIWISGFLPFSDHLYYICHTCVVKSYIVRFGIEYKVFLDIFSHYSRTYCSSCCRTKIADRLISKPFQVKTRKSMSPLFVELLFMTHGPRDANDYTHGQSKFDFTVHICYSKIAAEFTLYRWTFKNIKASKYKL